MKVQIPFLPSPLTGWLLCLISKLTNLFLKWKLNLLMMARHRFSFNEILYSFLQQPPTNPVFQDEKTNKLILILLENSLKNCAPHVLRAKLKKSWSKDGTIIFVNRGQFWSRIWRNYKKFLENSWEIETFVFLTKIR